MRPGQPVALNFTPHLVPMNRGILVYSRTRLSDKGRQPGRTCGAAYEKYYAGEYFVRVLGRRRVPGDQMGGGQQLCGYRIPELDQRDWGALS